MISNQSIIFRVVSVDDIDDLIKMLKKGLKRLTDRDEKKRSLFNVNYYSLFFKQINIKISTIFVIQLENRHDQISFSKTAKP